MLPCSYLMSQFAWKDEIIMCFGVKQHLASFFNHCLTNLPWVFGMTLLTPFQQKCKIIFCPVHSYIICKCTENKVYSHAMIAYTPAAINHNNQKL